MTADALRAKGFKIVSAGAGYVTHSFFHLFSHDDANTFVN